MKDDCGEQPVGTFRLGVQLTYRKKNGETVTLIEPYDSWLVTSNDAAHVATVMKRLTHGHGDCYTVPTVDELAVSAAAFEQTMSHKDKVVPPTPYHAEDPDPLDLIVTRLEGIDTTLNYINNNLDRIVRQGGR